MSLRKLLLFVITALSLVPATAVSPALETELRSLLEKKDAKIGVALIVNDNDTLTISNDERYPLMSVMKFHQAIGVARFLQGNKLPLTATVPVKSSHFKPDTYSPLRERYPNGNVQVSYAELMKYTLQLSDNNACDILFSYTLPPKKVQSYLETLGFSDFAIAVNEDDMHKRQEAAYENWSSPLSAACIVNRFFTAPWLPMEYSSFIAQVMFDCQTGADRLPGGLPADGVRIAHKTGTGFVNPDGRIMAVNDIGFVLLPDGRHYSIAVFIADALGTEEENAAIIAEISAIVYRYVLSLMS